jgi:MoxR-like ATPase
MDHADASQVCGEVLDEVERTVIGDREFFETVLTAVLADGHALLEDVPGTGKTLTARTLSTALGLEFNRIQFTPDLLPADITGTHVFNEKDREFEFSEGPIFANVVLADEINRAPPKTQAALLEAMEEEQVTVDGETHELPSPFFVLATQNPVEQEGTFQLPEAQVDRFTVKTSMGYPDRDGELELINRRADRTAKAPVAESIIDRETVVDFQAVPETVDVQENVREYIVGLGRETRQDSRVDVGVSPRGVQRFFEAARARAVLSGRSFVAPDDVQAVAQPVLAHRLVLTGEAQVRDTEKSEVIEDVLDRVAVPEMDE